ncbi:unnamed protein product [Adineta ricciae]|uniref:S1 motif domain-containing protein n=1 Tax=Adineta ricciae TaxID=249248 RepID=A0A813ZGC2_ADIRI|nr:unnamed protein product [Adineta ricciae]
MSTEIDYFPRGSSTTKAEAKPEKARLNRVDRDDLFVSTSTKRKRSQHDAQKLKEERKKKKKKALDGEDRQEALYRRLHKQNLTDGVLLCGCIEKITPYELRVSLPHQNIGYIPLSMISDEYTELIQQKLSNNNQDDDFDNLFHLGQYVICRVIEGESTSDSEKPNQQKRLHLSINPKDVCDQLTPDQLVKGMMIPGVVSSTTDHGFLINIGFSQRKGFLAKDKHLDEDQLKFGFHGLFQIKESSTVNSRIIPLKILDNKKPRTTLSPTKLPFHMLLPGLKCKVTVTKTRVNGLEVSFGEIKGFIHLQDFDTLKTPITDFSPEQELEATILSIDPTTKLIHYSMQPHLLALTFPPTILDKNNEATSPMIGSIQPCTVVRAIGSSLAIRLPSLKQYGVVSSTNLTDEKYDDIQQLLGSFVAGQKTQCRIIGISLSSNLAICSLKKSVLEAPFITYSDIQIGSLVKGTISQVNERGLTINLTKYINGFVPTLHNADIPIKETLNKFSLKKKVQCRVLQVDALRQRLILTMKPSLINTKIPIVYSYNDLQTDLLTIGVVTSIQEYGLLVKLFGGLCGLVPKTEIGQLQTLVGTSIKSQLQQMFYVGQTVSCKVLNFDAEEKKITLSLKVPGKMTFGSKLAAVPRDFSIGKVVCWIVSECENDEYLTGIALDEDRPKKALTVTLTKNHTSDFIEHQALLMRVDLSKKSTQQRQGIFWSHLSYINISMKKTLVEFCERSTLPQKFEDCIVGSIVPGVVQNIFDYGVFIDLPNTIVAFAPHKHLDLHGSLETAEKKYRIGQTVFVRILQLDEEKHRCIVSLKTLNYDGEIAELTQPENVLRTYLDEKYQLIQDMRLHGTGPLSKFFQETSKWIGLKSRCLIEKRSDDWFVGRLENGIPAALPYDAHYSIGDSLDGYIVDFSIPAQQFILTLDLKKPLKFSSQTFTQCTVLCQLQSYALALTTDSNQLVHLPTFSDLNSFYSSSSGISYKRNQQVDVSSIKPYTSKELNYTILPTPVRKSSIEVYQVDQTVPVTIVDVLPKQLNVKLNDGSRGRLHITELFDNPSPDQFQSLTDLYQVNQSLNARIIGTRNIEKDSKHQRPVYELSLREKSTIEYQVGDRIVGFVDKIDEKNKGLWLHLSLHTRGYVPPEHVSKELSIGQCCYVTIVKKTTNNKGEYYTLSMFEKNQSEASVVYAKFKEMKSINEFRFDVTRNNESYEGILVSTDVADVFEDFVFWKYLMNVKPPVLVNGQLNMKKELWKFRNKSIRAFVKEENSDKQQMILSTRKSKLEQNHLDVIDEEIETIEQISAGDILHGYIDVLTNRQITVLLGGGRSIVGQIEKVVNRTLNGHLREYLDVGMIVEAVVLNVDKEKNKCQMKLTDQFIEQLVSKRSKRTRLSRTNSLNGSIAGDDESQETNVKRLKTVENASAASALGSDLKFDWTDDLSALRSSMDDDVDAEQMDESISTSSATKERKLESNGSTSVRSQRSQEQYEELVKQAPNDSQLWMEYMQFFVDQAEIDRARTLAERALASIFYREERDKLNMWIAYLALENRHGTPEKVNSILSRALGNCDSSKVYQRLACDVYEKNGQLNDANATFALLVKKFNKDKQAWLEYIMYLFRHQQTEQAKATLDKSFSSLPSADHVEMINKFGQLEFKYGDKERAKTLYEKLLSSYPKRTDLWSIYIDMLIKYDPDPSVVARSIFDRVLALNIPPKKMKSLIKKYLQFEKQYGTTADLNRAKERITQYVNANDDPSAKSNIEDF